MSDSADVDMRRADLARAKLIKDIRQIKKMGDNMIEKTDSVIHKAPVLLGLGALGAALVGVAVYVGRSGVHHPRLARERSFLMEAARSAALSALGILAGRITQRLLTAAMTDGTQSQPAE
jgi:hypothetical protein